MVTAIEQDMDAVLNPVTEAEALIQESGSLRQRLGLDAQAFGMAIVATIQGRPALDGYASLDASAQAEIESLSARIVSIVNGLVSTPQTVEKLGRTAAETAVAVPRLVIQVQSEARLTARNPFAASAEKQRAQHELASIGELQSRVLSKVQEVQSRIATLPQRAVQALRELIDVLPTGGDLVALAQAASSGRNAAASSTAGISASPRPAETGVPDAPTTPLQELQTIAADIRDRTNRISMTLDKIALARATLRVTAERLKVDTRVLGVALIQAFRREAITHPDGTPVPDELAADIQVLADEVSVALVSVSTLPHNAGILQLRIIDGWSKAHDLAPREADEAGAANAVAPLARFSSVDPAATADDLLKAAQDDILAQIGLAQAALQTLPERLYSESTILFAGLPAAREELLALARSSHAAAQRDRERQHVAAGPGTTSAAAETPNESTPDPVPDPKLSDTVKRWLEQRQRSQPGEHEGQPAPIRNR